MENLTMDNARVNHPTHDIPTPVRKTPLCAEHEKLGAKMVDFAGWWMPIQYAGLKEEHLNVRKNVGLFDVSHMGEIRFLGENALPTLEWLTTNQVSKLATGQAQYSLLPNDRGGLVDDIIVYCLERNKDYLVCVNASNTQADFEWMNAHNKGATILNESSRWAQIAIQGPKAWSLIGDVLGIQKIPPFTLTKGKYPEKYCGYEIIFASTGYTGETGGEVFIETAGAIQLWNQLMQQGQSYQVMPIGLGARDTLRLEMKYSLYGHEINDTGNPYEAGLGWVIKPEAKEFLAKDLLLSGIKNGYSRKLIGFKLVDKGIPRQDMEVYSSKGEKIGKVTSGTLSPSLNTPIGMAYVETPWSQIGSEILIDIRGRKAKALVIKTPFVNQGA